MWSNLKIPEFKSVALPQHYNCALLDEIRHYESYVFERWMGSGRHANLSLTAGVRNAVPSRLMVFSLL